jgi:hypothetical protein
MYGENYLKQQGITPDPEPQGTPDPAPVAARAHTSTQPRATYFAPDSTADDQTLETDAGGTSGKSDEDEMREQIHGMLQQMNKSGDDFLELWDGTLEMDGGVTASNLKNAYKLLAKRAGGTLTPAVVNDTCNYYSSQLQANLTKAVQGKEAERKKLLDALQTEKQQLTDEVATFAKQIQDLIQQKASAESDLAQVDSKYAPKIQQIERRIALGKKMFTSFIAEMQSVLKLFNTVIQ